MKLKSLILGAALGLPLLALADNASTNPFAGPFVGAGLGYTNNNVMLGTQGIDVFSIGDGGIAGQVLAGYNYAINNNWVVGAEAYFIDNAVTLNVFDWSRLKMHHAYGADALLGYTLNNQAVMVFGGFGWAASQLTLSVNEDGSASMKTNYNGWTGIVGAQEILTGSLSLRESMDYTKYKVKTITDGLDFTPKQTTFMLSLIYTFNT